MKVFLKPGEYKNGIPTEDWCTCGDQRAVHEKWEGRMQCFVHNYGGELCDCTKFKSQNQSTTKE